MVVEDDFLISAQICDTIAHARGQIVGPFVTVTDAFEHMNVLDGVDVAVLDIGLTHETSYALAEALQITRIPVLFVTGKARDEIPSNFRYACYLQKPFSEHALVSSIAECYSRVRD